MFSLDALEAREAAVAEREAAVAEREAALATCWKKLELEQKGLALDQEIFYLKQKHSRLCSRSRSRSPCREKVKKAHHRSDSSPYPPSCPPPPTYPPPPSFAPPKKLNKCVQVLNSGVGTLIGTNGGTIGMIQCIADVSITIEKEPVKSNGTTVPMHELARNVHVESFSSESIEKAEKIILDLFAGEIDGRLLARGIFAPFLKSQ